MQTIVDNLSNGIWKDTKGICSPANNVCSLTNSVSGLANTVTAGLQTKTFATDLVHVCYMFAANLQQTKKQSFAAPTFFTGVTFQIFQNELN